MPCHLRTCRDYQPLRRSYKAKEKKKSKEVAQSSTASANNLKAATGELHVIGRKEFNGRRRRKRA
jgi:hypothetical protein